MLGRKTSLQDRVSNEEFVRRITHNEWFKTLSHEQKRAYFNSSEYKNKYKK